VVVLIEVVIKLTTVVIWYHSFLINYMKIFPNTFLPKGSKSYVDGIVDDYNFEFYVTSLNKENIVKILHSSGEV